MAQDNKKLEPLREIFIMNGKEVRFKIGQSLSQDEYLPGQILLIKYGTARLLINDKSNLTTITKLGPGDFIGIASHLRGQSCEEVRASEDLVAWCISDEKFLNLYREEEQVRNCCNYYLWDAELIFFIKQYFPERIYNNQMLIKDCFNKIKGISRVIQPNSKEVEQELSENKILCICSNNTNTFFGRKIKTSKEIQEILLIKPPFQIRILSLPPKDIIFNNETINKNPEENIRKKNNNDELRSIPFAQSFPPVSSLSEPTLSKKLFFYGNGDILGTLACLETLSALMKFPLRRDSIEKNLKDYLKDNRSPSLNLCGQILYSHGLSITISKVSAKFGSRLKQYTLIPWKDNFAIVIISNQAGLTIFSPSEGNLIIKSNQLDEIFPQGIDLLLVEKSNISPNKVFGLGWFWPALISHKGVLLQVLLAGFVLQLLTLAHPLLLQVIIDKVMIQRSLDTLQVLGVALLIVTIMEGILGSLKTFLLTDTTNRIDQRLGVEVIDHLLRLPLSYFSQRPTGELSARIGELEKIRFFFTSQAFTTIIDAVFSVIYLIVMILYSLTLTLVSLIVLPIQILLTILAAPLLKRQFRKVAEANARTQSYLIESLNGIETVKAQNIEIKSRWKWQDLYSQYINLSFEKTISGTTLNQLSQALQKTSQLLVLWVGATMVLKGQISLGQLIAFRIISGYVTQPLLRLSTIWLGIQELKVSFERLADVLDSPKESNDIEKEKSTMPPIHGDLTFEDVDFSFIKGNKPTLRNINFSTKGQNFIGIVGQSGSGKSSLMKLLPRLYSPDKGRILVDGVDIQKVEIDSLRRQIGIVPQEPLLFKGTIGENISLAHPEASNEDIINAAKLANAHDFIMDLSGGYSTKVNERGSTLSGGQRQCITIARSLLGNPKLLILDEATSSLDYESERKLCSNLFNQLNNCTVFFITHRLASIKHANIIIMMHNGTIEEIGRHKDLMDKKGRYYALYRQQETE